MTPTDEIKPTWESLIASFQCPDWFRDAKFGVWSHWGPQAVPGQGDWYARHMYMPDHPIGRYHRRVYGHPSEFGYKDIVRQWKAERFDAEALVGFFADHGARYFVGQACHCDNFDLFDSRHHRWNSVNMGPGRDILGAFRDATRNAGLPWGFSEHLAWSYSWFNVNKGADKTGPYRGVPYDGNDPDNADFYFPPHDETEAQFALRPSREFVRSWQERLIDAIDRYEPDLFYTDGGVPFGDDGLKVVAHFYRAAQQRFGGPGGVFNYKDVGGRRPDFKKNTGTFVAGAGVEDLEHGVVDGISDDPWQCDTSSGPWYWMPSAAYLSPARIIQTLADVVSKNGNLLLNYTQRPDGSLDEETEWIATEVGKWLDINGESIFGTRPWKVAAEGANTFGSGEMSLLCDATFDATDARYTAKGDTRFAIAFGKPSARDGGWCFESMRGEQVDRVTLLGHGDALAWSLNDDGLVVQRPDGLRGDHAWCFKIE